MECYKSLLSKGVNILLGQPVHKTVMCSCKTYKLKKRKVLNACFSSLNMICITDVVYIYSNSVIILHFLCMLQIYKTLCFIWCHCSTELITSDLCGCVYLWLKLAHNLTCKFIYKCQLHQHVVSFNIIPELWPTKYRVTLYWSFGVHLTFIMQLAGLEKNGELRNHVPGKFWHLQGNFCVNRKSHIIV